VRAFSLEGIDIDLSVKDTLIYAKKAGLKTELFVRPCRGKSAKFQIDSVVLVIANQYYDRFWLFLEENPNVGCGWPNDYKANCEYIKEMLGQLKTLPPDVPARLGWDTLTEVFDRSEGRDLRELIAQSIDRESLAMQRERKAAEVLLATTQAELDGMFCHLEQLLTQANFYQVPHKKPKMDQNIRNIFARNALTHQEVQTLRGIFKALAQKKG
jgi:hypothetical protein